MKKNLFILMFVFLSMCLFAQEPKTLFSHTDVIKRHYLVGIELAELAQNSFRDIGPENWTIHYGQMLTEREYFNIGWSTIAFNVNLAPEHLKQTPIITGNNDNLLGDLSVIRIGTDIETINLSFFPLFNRYILRIIPLVGLNIGYYEMGIRHSIEEESFSFSSITLGARSAIRIYLFDVLYYDFQVDWLLFAFKSNSGIGTVGEADINYNNFVPVQITMTIGINIKN